ncbi:MAG: WYL domain-containing protein [Deinococcales bacterium]
MSQIRAKAKPLKNLRHSRLNAFVDFLLKQPRFLIHEAQQALEVERQSVNRLMDKLKKQGIEFIGRKQDKSLLRAEYQLSPESLVRLQRLKELGFSLKGGQDKPQKIFDYEHFNEVFHDPLAEYPVYNILALVIQAIFEKRVAKVTYLNKRGKKNSYKLHCYKLFIKEHRLHVASLDHNSIKGVGLKLSHLQDRRLDSFLSFELLDEAFEELENIDSHLDRDFAFFTFHPEQEKPRIIRLKFSPKKANEAAHTKRHLSDNSSKEPQLEEDGSFVYQLEIPLTDALVWWLASYGGHVQVLEPPELKEKLINFHLTALKNLE